MATCFFFFQAEDGIRDWSVTGVQTCALPIWERSWRPPTHSHLCESASTRPTTANYPRAAPRLEPGVGTPHPAIARRSYPLRDSRSEVLAAAGGDVWEVGGLRSGCELGYRRPPWGELLSDEEVFYRCAGAAQGRACPSSSVIRAGSLLDVRGGR